jgi:hypothetical protein
MCERPLPLLLMLRPFGAAVPLLQPVQVMSEGAIFEDVHEPRLKVKDENRQTCSRCSPAGFDGIGSPVGYNP